MNTENNHTPFGLPDDKAGDEGMETRLWEFIDGRSSGNEKNIIEQLLENNQLWKKKYKELIDIHRLVQSTELEEPSMRFTKNVMEQIAKLHIAPAAKNYINNKIIWGIAAFFILLLTSFLVYGFGQLNWHTTGDSKFSIDFGKVDYSKIFNNTYVNIFMLINVVLGLFLLDRFLSIKKKGFQKES